jgi:hypothetical protein
MLVHVSGIWVVSILFNILEQHGEWYHPVLHDTTEICHVSIKLIFNVWYYKKSMKIYVVFVAYIDVKF